jgi:hypothetical protein
METMEPNLALSMYGRAVEVLTSASSSPPSTTSTTSSSLLPQLAHAYERIGECLAQNGDVEGAKKAFEEANKVEETGSRRLLMGQVTGGTDSLGHMKRGIELLEGEMAGNNGMEEEGKEAIPVSQLLCQAYCNVADLWMTDLCMDPSAETSAVSAVESALKYDTGAIPDALQALANLRLSQNRGGDAAEAMTEVWKRIGGGCKAMAEVVGLGDKVVEESANPMTVEGGAVEVEQDALDEVNKLPGFEFR